MTKHAHDLGLTHDLALLTQRALHRRNMLRWTFGVGAVSLIGCAAKTAGFATGNGSGLASDAGASAGGSAADGGDAAGSGSATCNKIPEETAGPYPGDGSNGVNALSLTGIVRSDIRSSFDTASAVAAGVLHTVTLTIVNTADGCAPLPGCAVYLWHCDRSGNYSLYSDAVKAENYLRGVQETDAAGQVTFQSIFPACYSGRWPHIHFEVYPSLSAIGSASNKIATSQLALPEDVCRTVFAESGYEQSVSNLARITLATDNVFSDGVSSQTPSVSGSVASGFASTLRVPVSV